MNTSTRKRKSSERKDFERKLATLNCKRGIGLAVAMSILLIIYYFLCRGEKKLPYWYNAMLIVVFTIQIAMSVLLVYIVRNAQGMMTQAYRMYYITTFVFFMPVCVADFNINSSIMLYVAAMALTIFIPVLQRNEMHMYTLIMAVATVVYCICISLGGFGRNTVEAAAAGVCAMLAGRYAQERFRGYERASSESRVKNILSTEDSLTGLTNKSGLINTATVMWQFCARSRSIVGAIFIDVDYFKDYNDTFGHDEGDECLKKIAQAIADCARSDTDTVARVGGEAFFVLVQGVEKENLIALALKIRSSIAQLKLEREYTGTSNYITVSIGAAYGYPSDGTSFKNLYDSAADAMYIAKENGRNCIVCDGCVYGRMKNGVGTAIGN